jgi:hypothetical protein
LLLDRARRGAGRRAAWRAVVRARQARDAAAYDICAVVVAISTSLSYLVDDGLLFFEVGRAGEPRMANLENQSMQTSYAEPGYPTSARLTPKKAITGPLDRSNNSGQLRPALTSSTYDTNNRSNDLECEIVGYATRRQGRLNFFKAFQRLVPLHQTIRQAST